MKDTIIVTFSVVVIKKNATVKAIMEESLAGPQFQKVRVNNVRAEAW